MSTTSGFILDVQKISKLDWTCLETPTILAFYCLADLKLTYKLLAQQCWVLLESSRQARFHGIRHRLESCEHLKQTT